LKLKIVTILTCLSLSGFLIAKDETQSRKKLKKYIAMEQMKAVALTQQSDSPPLWLRHSLLNSNSLGIKSEDFLAKARSSFQLQQYHEAINYLNVYIYYSGEQATAVLLRGLSYKLSSPEIPKEACKDFLTLANSGFDIGVIEGLDTFCSGQQGWFGR
jgi:hypothetical protein